MACVSRDMYKIAWPYDPLLIAQNGKPLSFQNVYKLLFIGVIMGPGELTFAIRHEPGLHQLTLHPLDFGHRRCLLASLLQTSEPVIRTPLLLSGSPLLRSPSKS